MAVVAAELLTFAQEELLWLPMHDVRLRELAGTVEAGEVARRLTKEFDVPRTECAVRHRAAQLGVSVRARVLTLNDVARLFYADARCVRSWWIDTGLLVARRRVSRSAHAHWWIHPSDLERFVRECGWAYDWRRMPVGHPLRALAEVVDRPDPWLDLRALARFLEMPERTVMSWVRKGLIPHRRRYETGGVGEPVIRRSDFPGIKTAIEDAHATHMERARAASARVRGLGVRRPPAWLRNYRPYTPTVSTVVDDSTMVER